MKRKLLYGAAVLATLVAAGAMALSRSGRAGLASGEVPVFLVSRAPFIRTVEAEGTLRAMRATPITAPVDLPGVQKIEWLAPDGTPVHAGDVVARIDSTLMEMDLADGLDDLEIARLNARQAEESRAAQREGLGLDSTLAGREADYTRAFAPRDPEVFSRQEIIDSEIDSELAEEKVGNARGKLEVAHLQGKNELEMLQLDRLRAEQKIARARKGLEALEVRAPHDGIFLLSGRNYGDVLRPGTDLWPGMQIAEIPDPAAMQARVYVLDADAAGLKVGCRATLRIEAHPEKIYPGRVVSVDALAKRRASNLPMEFFEAVVQPDETDPATMKPGLGVSASITLEELPSALTVPPQAVFQIEGKPIAFRREAGRFSIVPLRTGARSLARIQILGGLKEGDAVALRDPRQTLSFDLPAGTGEKAPAPPSGSPP